MKESGVKTDTNNPKGIQRVNTAPIFSDCCQRPKHRPPLSVVLPLLFVGLLSSTALSQTSLAGPVTRDTLYATGNPFFITDDITIPKGKQCIIGAGCILLFKQFTGLIVEGTLIVNGTADQPVILTSNLDTRYNNTPAGPTDTAQVANPFDWKGIDILNSSMNTSICNAYISYTVNGINSGTPLITVSGCYFSNNGQYDFIINGNIINVNKGIPFSYTPTIVPQSPGPAQKKPPTISDFKKPLRYGSLAVGVLGAVAGTVLAIMSAQDNNDIPSMKPGFINPANGKPYTRSDVDAAIRIYNQKKHGSIAGFSVGAAGLCGFAVTFTIK